MAKKRMVWKSSLSDPDLARSSDSVRLLWDALIQLSDDEGRRLADPDSLRAEIWRYHPRKRRRWVEETLRQLAQKMPNFLLYEVAGRSYYALKNWSWKN